MGQEKLYGTLHKEGFGLCGICNQQGQSCVPLDKSKGESKQSSCCYGVHYLLPRQDDDTDELFYRELNDISRASFAFLMGDFNFLAIYWECHTGDTNRSWKFLKLIAGTKGAK